MRVNILSPRKNAPKLAKISVLKAVDGTRAQLGMMFEWLNHKNVRIGPTAKSAIG